MSREGGEGLEKAEKGHLDLKERQGKRGSEDGAASQL